MICYQYILLYKILKRLESTVIFLTVQLLLFVFVTQLACEFNRIMGRDVVADINCIWQTAYLKIIAIAKEEGIENHNISDMITGLPMDMPDGKLRQLA